MNIDEFLGHKGSSRGGGGAYLENWKEDGSVEVVLHPRATVAGLWGHGWYRIADYESKNDGHVVEVRSKRWNCLEPEAILQEMRKRDDEDRRKFPPTVCPYCIALEYVRDLVNDNKLSWVEPIFQFDAEGADSRIIHAGGWCGLIGDKKKTEYTKDELAELRQAGIRLDKVFQENGFPRLQYLMRVVAARDPGAGCVITFESQALGDAVKSVIRKEIASLGEKGDLRRYPYAMLWTYDEKKQFKDKYDATAIRQTPIEGELLAALQQDPPSIDEHTARGNVRELRASMEEHCLINDLMDWDAIFRPAMELADEIEEENNEARDKADSRSTSFDYGANAKSSPVDSNPADSDEVECTLCKGAMLMSQSECPHCHCTYDADGNAIPAKPKEEPKPPARAPLRSRGQAAPQKQAAPPREPQGGAPAERGHRFRAPSRGR